jgi:hypothetical protein
MLAVEDRACGDIIFPYLRLTSKSRQFWTNGLLLGTYPDSDLPGNKLSTPDKSDKSTKTVSFLRLFLFRGFVCPVEPPQRVTQVVRFAEFEGVPRHIGGFFFRVDAPVSSGTTQ